jgi:hypothetical protein
LKREERVPLENLLTDPAPKVDIPECQKAEPRNANFRVALPCRIPDGRWGHERQGGNDQAAGQRDTGRAQPHSAPAHFHAT